MIYKILPLSDWQAARAAGYYTGSGVDRQDGFIHFSAAGQVIETAARHFAGQAGLVLLTVDEGQLGDALKWEVSRGGEPFPHLYGDLPLAAVVKEEPLPWQDGRHKFPHGFA